MPEPAPAPDPDRLDGLLSRAALTTPQKIALRGDRTQLTYAQLDERVSRCASVLRGKFHADGQLVALAAALDPSTAVAYYGTIRAGATVAIVNPHLRQENLVHALRTSSASVAIVTAEMHTRLKQVRDRLPSLRHVVLISGNEDKREAAATEGPASLDALIDNAHAVEERAGVGHPEDVACIQFTSGTTGPPKGVRLSHRNLIANAGQVARAHRLDGDAVMLNHLPLFHPMHLNAGVAAMATHILCAADDVADSIEAANAAGATHFYSLPVRLARLADDPRLPRLCLNTVRTILSGGSTLPPHAARTLSAHFGVATVQGYGLAETSPLTHADLPERPTPRSVGPPVEGTECRVVGVESREPLPSGKPGEVQVRGPQVMQGYLAGVEAPIDADGWLSTGDVGYIGDSGVLFLVDRLKDVFKCDNELVSPSEIETVLARHPQVADCAVVDVPHPYSGAVAHAFVVPRSAEAHPEAIVAETNEELADFERVRGIDFTDSIPRSPNGKVLRRELRERAKFNTTRRVAMVTVINRLTVSGDASEFERAISAITGYMKQQPGFIGHQLYRSRTNPQVYVETAEWTAAELHRKAMTADTFRNLVKDLGKVASAEPDVFEVVAD
ncbi:AMP-binding protein (plasmid) [Streptomyces sp. NBC_00390]|uniref:AMP-binding protein n=1 Tax=Streptomyces sp. NBC_00390 TaxID=2975736 RepID=UPI002E1FB0C5